MANFLADIARIEAVSRHLLTESHERSFLVVSELTLVLEISIVLSITVAVLDGLTTVVNKRTSALLERITTLVEDLVTALVDLIATAEVNSEELVDESSNESTKERTDDVDPPSADVVAEDRRTKRSGRIQTGSGQIITRKNCESKNETNCDTRNESHEGIAVDEEISDNKDEGQNGF